MIPRLRALPPFAVHEVVEDAVDELCGVGGAETLGQLDRLVDGHRGGVSLWKIS